MQEIRSWSPPVVTGICDFIYLFIFNLFNVDKLIYIFDIWR